MTKLTTLLILIFSTNLFSGQTNKIETAHFKVKYDIEAEKYVNASLKVLELAWTIANNNDYNIPDKIEFIVKKTDRCVLYFDRKSLKGITLEYDTMDSFNSPKQGGKNNIYGLCHELGHLCMFNTTTNKNNWMSYNFRESWADFWGNFVIDSVYAELGTDFWPNPYNYLEFSGTDYMKKRIEQNNPKILEFNKSGQFWINVNSIIGFDKMSQIFDQVNFKKVSNPDAKNEFLTALKAVSNDKDIESLYNEYSDILILNNK